MKRNLSKLIIGVLLFTGLCASPLTIAYSEHNEMKGGSMISHQMDGEGLACCESHEKEANLLIGLNTKTGDGKTKHIALKTELFDEVPLKTEFTSSSPIRPPSHKYLASVIRLE